MRWNVVANTLGRLLTLFSVPLLVPGLVALLLEPADLPVLGVLVPRNALVFLTSAAAALLVGIAIRTAGKEADLYLQEAYAVVALGWLGFAGVGAIPLIAAGLFTHPVDALFEAMSGLTTTGYTVVPIPLEEVAPSLHFWRALLQWMGGMGVVVFTIAILHEVATSGAHLMRAEVPGERVERLTPRIQATARLLWTIYAGLTAVGIALLFLVFTLDVGLGPGPALFEAIFHGFTAIATGGFSTRSASIEAFDSLVLQWALLLIMLVGAANFALHYQWIRGNRRAHWADDEFRFYLSAVGIGGLLVFALLWWGFTPTGGVADVVPEGLVTTLTAAVFQLASAAINAGFTSADYTTWPEAARFLIFFAMFMGGSIGSTGGSIKVGRILVAFKLLLGQLRRITHPRAVAAVTLSGVVVDRDTQRRLGAFIFLYLVTFATGTFLFLLLMDLDPFQSASWAAGALGNVGASFGGLSPGFDYAATPAGAKVVAILLMWLGRLELFAVLVLFIPDSDR